MIDKDDRLVNMEHVIGELVHKYNVPIMSFEALTTLGKRAVTVYGLEPQAKKIPFSDLCDYITAFIQTPFGNKVLNELKNV